MRKYIISALFASLVLIGQAQRVDVQLDADGIMRVGAPINIVTIGNSITDGYSNTSRYWAWPEQMNRLIGSDYQVLNYAVSGTTMGQKASASFRKTSSYPKAVAANPDILVIAHGTNDADPWRWDQWGGEFKDDYLSMVASFRQEGRNPILYCTLAPPLFSDRKAKQNQYIEEKLIPKQKEVAAELGAPTIDFHTDFVGKAEFFPDNVHPSDPCAAAMAEIAKKVIISRQMLTSQIKVNKGTIVSPTMVVVEQGSSVKLIPSAPYKGTWTWTGPNGLIANSKVLSLKNITSGGTYTVNFTDAQGRRAVLRYLISVRGQQSGSITPNVSVPGSPWQQTTTVTVHPGQDLTFGPSLTPAETEGGFWSWRGPNGFFAYGRQQTINTMTAAKAGRYGVTYTDVQGRQTSAVFDVKVEGEPVCPKLSCHIRDDNGWKQTTTLAVKPGTSITFGPHPLNGHWSWTGPNGFRSNERQNQLFDFNADMAGQYVGTYTNEAGCREQLIITLTVASADSIGKTH